MEHHDQNEPPAKRRKLAFRQDTKPSQHSYVTLAEASIEVTVAKLEKRNNRTDGLSDSAVTIEAILNRDHSRGGQRSTSIEVSAPWLKERATLDTNIDDARTRAILEDCTRIDSTVKKQAEYAVLTCHDAKLHVGEDSARLHVKILWHDTASAPAKTNPVVCDILARCAPDHNNIDFAATAEAWDVKEFYDNVHIPQPCEATDRPLKIDLLHCKLYAFQNRAVNWLLSREGVQIRDKDQALLPTDKFKVSTLPTGFTENIDTSGDTYYANPVIGVACSSRDDVVERYSSIKGGLLGEAMGLGKTVEMIALMCLHTMDNTPVSKGETSHLKRSGATLIITPPSILDQWRQEIQCHAPSLRVYNYNGIKATSKKARSAIIEELREQDVVLTTYQVIARELHYVMERPDRALRDRPRLEPPKSPLDQILWWRVCLDEAQMIESGVSAAATVARLIPRVNAWAVTGTPLKQWHRDLYGLLLFLRYEPWCNSAKMWDYLVFNHRHMFRSLMQEIAIRHSKEAVRDELCLPQQNRRTISVAFTNIEQAHYSQLFYEMYTSIGLNRDGSPLADDWDPNSPAVVEGMRTWLTRLRQTCLHPEVGGRNRRALGRNHGPLRTVEQVLDVMIDQTEGMLRAEQRNMLLHKVRQGQIYENAKQREDAMRLYSEAYNEADEVVKNCRKALETELARQKLVENTKERDVHEDQSDDDSEKEDADSPLLAARQRLRSALEVKHVCIFFMANIFYQLKSDEDVVKPESDEFNALEKKEVEAYEEAKKIRSELLQEVVRKANRQVTRIKSKQAYKELVVIPDMSLDLDYTGIESRKIYEKLYKFCESMNIQAEQMNELRGKMLRFIQQALIDEDEGVELQGDEYENSLKHQDEMYACMEALRALYADRSDAITGQENLLIRSEMKTFLKMAKDKEGPAPELMIKLLAERESKRIKIAEQGSLRGIVAELRALSSSLQWSDAAGHSSRAKAEMHVCDQILQHATKLMASQNKCLASLEQEVGHFRNSMNARLEYYKGLQRISDTVAPYREDDVGKPLDEAQLQKSAREENNARTKCSTVLAKSRYLLHLKAESMSDTAERICTICQSEFDTGTITSCGHVFCKDDIILWYREHGTCPVCKKRLKVSDFFDITYKPSEMAVQAEESTRPDSPSSTTERVASENSIYSDISGRQLDEIKNIEIRGASFGSKVDTICRHLHWLREKDPGSKTLVFSQFREVLDVLGRAFRQNEISYSRCDDKGAIQDFKSNPAIEVFLLHARAHSAGLNLVVASHVILCEPLINTALELQAIARVHRIGQHRQTTVWMYLISDTVEESIYDISARRRLAHITTRDQLSRSGTQTPVLLQESIIDAANSKELQAADLSKALAPGKNGGELVDKGDLWACLFGNPAHGKDRAPEVLGADGEVGRFLRAEAAERRRG